jgi:hypothetical protein
MILFNSTVIKCKYKNSKLHHWQRGNTMSTGVVYRQNNQFRKFLEENLQNCAYEVVMRVNPYLHPHTLEKL